eukprot:7085806-Prymnesium_polylepis.3
MQNRPPMLPRDVTSGAAVHRGSTFTPPRAGAHRCGEARLQLWRCAHRHPLPRPWAWEHTYAHFSLGLGLGLEHAHELLVDEGRPVELEAPAAGEQQQHAIDLPRGHVLREELRRREARAERREQAVAKEADAKEEEGRDECQREYLVELRVVVAVELACGRGGSI